MFSLPNVLSSSRILPKKSLYLIGPVTLILYSLGLLFVVHFHR